MFEKALAISSSFLPSSSVIGGLVKNHALPKDHSLLACLNLLEAKQQFHAHFPEEEWMLPNDGSLIFTLNFEEYSGISEEDKHHFSVTYAHNIEVEEGDNGSFVNFAPFVSRPSNERLDNGFDEDDYDQFIKSMEQEYFKGPHHQLLGFPIPIQGDDGEDECVLMSKKAFNLVSFPEDWVLLCQIDSDDDKDMMFGDCGTLYFFIHKRDLKNKDFSRVWMTMQCY